MYNAQDQWTAFQSFLQQLQNQQNPTQMGAINTGNAAPVNQLANIPPAPWQASIGVPDYGRNMRPETPYQSGVEQQNRLMYRGMPGVTPPNPMAGLSNTRSWRNGSGDRPEQRTSKFGLDRYNWQFY